MVNDNNVYNLLTSFLTYTDQFCFMIVKLCINKIDINKYSWACFPRKYFVKLRIILWSKRLVYSYVDLDNQHLGFLEINYISVPIDIQSLKAGNYIWNSLV